MATYMFQGAYTSESWKAQLQEQQNPVDRVGPLAEKVGGRVIAAYYAFGEYDVIAIMEMPDEEAMVAWALAVSAGGALRAGKTTPLMSVEQGQAGMKRAAEIASSYRVPGGE